MPYFFVVRKAPVYMSKRAAQCTSGSICACATTDAVMPTTANRAGQASPTRPISAGTGNVNMRYFMEMENQFVRYYREEDRMENLVRAGEVFRVLPMA